MKRKTYLKVLIAKMGIRMNFDKIHSKYATFVCFTEIWTNFGPIVARMLVKSRVSRIFRMNFVKIPYSMRLLTEVQTTDRLQTTDSSARFRLPSFRHVLDMFHLKTFGSNLLLNITLFWVNDLQIIY